ncbi:chromate transporter [Roseomonas sp. E05]|uniref:chromate transporter n=1 Tax=Roseomonas sp. E05 TaxID=3046310 RepID=UPI0024B8B557|nr:chromate transporter [Roseomonas sp. E05]MDJ0390164.1 chromate transporter [Roseomonas sp. E05]
MSESPLLRLLLIHLPLSFLTVGGGQSIISELHRQVVPVQGWMSDAEFLNLFALSRMTPGPGALLSSMVGWQVAGWPGAVVASFALFAPSSVLVFGLAHLWRRSRGAAWTRAVEMGLAPVAAGMILAAGFTLLRAAEGGVLAWAVAAASTALLMFTRVSPFLLLGAGGLIFALLLG